MSRSGADRLSCSGLDPDDFWHGRVENALGLWCWHDGRPERALQAFRIAERMFAASDSERWQAGSMTNQAFVLSDLGEEHLDAALERWGAADVRHRHADSWGWAFVNTGARARAMLLAGRHAEAIEIVEAARREPIGDGYAENRAMLTCILGESLAEQGDDRARAELEDAIERLEATQGDLMLRRFRVGVALAELLSAAGEADAARDQLRSLRPVREARRITKRHEVWHIREANTRYLELIDDLRDDDL